MKATLEQLIQVRSQVAEGLIPYLKRVDGEMKKHHLLRNWGKHLDNFVGLLRSAPEAAERLERFAVAPSEVSFPAYVHLRAVAKELRKGDDLRNFLEETKCSPTVALTDSDYFIAAVLRVLRRQFTPSDPLVRYVWEKLREPHSANEKAKLLLFLEGWGEVLGGDEQLTRCLNQLAERPEIALFYVPPPVEGSLWQSFLYWLLALRRYLESLWVRLLNSVKRHRPAYAAACVLFIVTLTAIWFVSDQPILSSVNWESQDDPQASNQIILSAEIEHTSTFFPGGWLYLAKILRHKEHRLVLGPCQAVINGTPFRMQCAVEKAIFREGRVTLQVLQPKELSEGSSQKGSEYETLHNETLK